jgi:hypothetical protein
MTKKSLFIFMLLIPALPLFPAAPVTVIRSDAEQLVVEYNNTAEKIERTVIAGTVYRRIIPSLGEQLLRISGSPELPFISFAVGIPPRGEVALKVVLEEVRDIRHITLPPAPSCELVENKTGGSGIVAMREVLSRRFARGKGAAAHSEAGEEATGVEEPSAAKEADRSGSWDLPDLFVVDGGRGQLGAAMAAAEDLGIGLDDFIALGRETASHGDSFCLTVLALRTSAFCNGVSKLHSETSRKMWRSLWPELPEEEIPITSITNGIHTLTWISQLMRELLDRYLGPRFREEPEDHLAQPIRRSIRVDDPHPPGELPLVEVDGEGDVVARVGEGEPSVKEG